MNNNDYIIEIKNISKSFGDKCILDDVSINVKKGEFVTILGPSGCGKTTMLRLLAGFGQADNSGWPLLANTILIVLAIHCGCSGSTTGGIKADRMYISLKAIWGDFQKRLHPSSLFRTRVGGRVLVEDTVNSVFLYIVLYIFVLFLSFVAVLICGLDIADAFSGTIASLGNVGPGIGQIGTMGNYSEFPAIAKFIFTIDMFFGRVEIFPILIVFSMIGNRQK